MTPSPESATEWVEDARRAGDADRVLVAGAPRAASVSALSGNAPSRFDPSRIPWHIGATPESYGTMVWASRVQNLRCHFALILDYVPEDSDWLARQVRSAIAQADGYLRDWSPLCDSDGSGEAGETRSGSTEGDSAGRQASPEPTPPTNPQGERE